MKKCPKCLDPIRVNKDGRLRVHNRLKGMGGGGLHFDGWALVKCEGSGVKP